ncbi:MAG: hypothetical protein AAFR63_16405, partial [Cyanobacteria bacterium J06631_6]
SLTTKIANYFLLFALITVGIMGGVAYCRSREALEQVAFDRLMSRTIKSEVILYYFRKFQLN